MWNTSNEKVNAVISQENSVMALMFVVLFVKFPTKWELVIYKTTFFHYNQMLWHLAGYIKTG